MDNYTREYLEGLTRAVEENAKQIKELMNIVQKVIDTVGIVIKERQ